MRARLIEVVFVSLGFLFFHTPFFLKRALARILAIVLFRALQFRRQIILHNLALCFSRVPEEPMASWGERLEDLAEENTAHFVLMIFEMFERYHWTKGTTRTRVRVKGWEHCEKYLTSKRGFFLLSAHLGNWELETAALVHLGVPLSIVTKTLHVGVMDQVWVRARKRFELDLIAEKDSAREIIKKVKAGRVIGFMLDQHTPEPHGIEASFFGRRCLCPRALSVFEPRLDAPVVPVSFVRTRLGEFVLEFEAPLKDLDPEDPRKHVESCNRVLEDQIRRHPEQYLWLHRRFKLNFDYKSRLPWEL